MYEKIMNLFLSVFRRFCNLEIVGEMLNSTWGRGKSAIYDFVLVDNECRRSAS